MPIFFKYYKARAERAEAALRDAERTTAAIILAAGGKVIVPDGLFYDDDITMVRVTDKIEKTITFSCVAGVSHQRIQQILTEERRKQDTAGLGGSSS